MLLGMQMPNHFYNDYKFSFHRQEKDNEIKGVNSIIPYLTAIYLIHL